MFLIKIPIHKKTIFGPWVCIKEEEKIHITTAELAYDFGSALKLRKATFLITGVFHLKIHLSKVRFFRHFLKIVKSDC